MSEPIIGIDLGTTNSEVSIIENGKTKLIKVDGSYLMPSVVSIGANGEVLVGKSAENNSLVAPENTVALIKRQMGKDKTIVLGGKNYTPPMISSLILQKLKQAAESYSGKEIKKAVITVPAFFNEAQREATQEAGELAGLEVLRLLNEPTSAALSYAMGQKKEELCLVYDLGGGTFDVSIVDLSQDVMEVRTSHGDINLGGADIDRLIFHQAVESFEKEHGINLAEDPLASARLMLAAEKAKVQLSKETSATIREEYICQKEDLGLHLTHTINRVEFEKMVRPIIERTITSVNVALEQASCEASSLDRVILVGGSTYIPLVSQILESKLNIVPQAWLDPNTVVARGAAIEAASLSGLSMGVVMIDVTPHSLGVEVLDEYNELVNDILIRRNSPLPAVASRVFYKEWAIQEQVEIRVFQGESPVPEHNQVLGEYLLKDIQGSSESDDREIIVKFELDKSGLLRLYITDMATGKVLSEEIKKVKSSRSVKKNLVELETVKIFQKEEGSLDSINEEDEETFETINVDGEIGQIQEAKEIEAIEVSAAESKSDEKVGLLDTSLIEKVDNLLKGSDISDEEKEELQAALTMAKEENSKEAKEDLSNLLYFLE